MQIKLNGQIVALWTPDQGLVIDHLPGCTADGCANGCPVPAWPTTTGLWDRSGTALPAAVDADRATFNIITAANRPDRLVGARLLEAKLPANGAAPQFPRMRVAGGPWLSSRIMAALGHGEDRGLAFLHYGDIDTLETEDEVSVTWMWPAAWTIDP